MNLGFFRRGLMDMRFFHCEITKCFTARESYKVKKKVYDKFQPLKRIDGRILMNMGFMQINTIQNQSVKSRQCK